MSQVIDKDAVNDLVKNKESIVVKDGVLEIDKNHPDYKYWIEED